MKDMNELTDRNLIDLFQQFFNNSNDPLFITDADFKITEYNDAFDKLFQKEDVCAKREYLMDIFEKEKTWSEVLSILTHEGQVDDYMVVCRDYEDDRLYVLI